MNQHITNSNEPTNKKLDSYHFNSTLDDNNIFESYQRFTEETIFELSTEITMLETKLNIFMNLLEISNYINRYIKSQDLFTIINDMLIGVLGARFSTIYIKSEDDYTQVSSKTCSDESIDLEKKLIEKHNQEKFILNSDTPLYPVNNIDDAIYSCLGVPITVDSGLLGFILIQHVEKNYFSDDHSKFLSLLANHIGIAIENNILYNQIKDSACKDGLTNIFNKKYFFDTLKQLPNILDLDYTIVMIDIDNFKKVNDTFGHPYGDKVLKVVSSIIKNSVRPNDIVARYGGEEIIIFLDNFINKEKISTRIEQLRLEIQDTLIPGDDFESSVTASFGIYVKCEEQLSLDTVIKRADDNLYICKRTGKNKYVLNT